MINFLKRIIKPTPAFEIKDIIDFEYMYSTGNMMYAYVIYRIKYMDGIYKALIKPNHVADEAALEIEVNVGFLKELEALLVKNQADKWNGFRGSDLNVLDGYDFAMHMVNSQGQRFGASGYMKWPKNYDIVKRGIDTLFKGLLPEKFN